MEPAVLNMNILSCINPKSVKAIRDRTSEHHVLLREGGGGRLYLYLSSYYPPVSPWVTTGIFGAFLDKMKCFENVKTTKIILSRNLP